MRHQPPTASSPSLPFTTDEIAAQVRDICRVNPHMADIARPVAADFAAAIRERLPYLDPADIAAVLLHAGSFVGTFLAALQAGGVRDDVAGAAAVNVVAIAGEQMDRRARRNRPDPS